MSSFDDANVDKDLLSQIFADEGDDDNEETDALLDELLKEAEGAEDKSGADDIFADLTAGDDSEAALADIAAEVKAEENTEGDAAAAVAFATEEAPAEEVKEEPVQEELTIEEPVAEEPVAEEPVVEETVAEEVKEEEDSQDEEKKAKKGKKKSSAKEDGDSVPKFEQNSDKDPVRKEAVEKIETERNAGNTTTITSGTTINGSIVTDGSLEVMGVITGDIECEGMVSIVGQVTGNVLAQSEIYVSTERSLHGDLSSEGAVKIGVGTVVVGDVNGTSSYIAGAVKGNIDVNGHVEVDSTAIIRGDINAKSIQVNSGAVVDGKMSLNYAGVDLDSFFEEQ